MCEKCEYFKAHWYSHGEGYFQAIQDECLNCKVKFPWLTESQFKEKSYVKR